jgi:pectate lyase
MKSLRLIAVFFCLCAWSLAGCSSDPPCDHGQDAGVDPDAEAPSDAATDAALDVGPDSSDARADVVEDAVEDAIADDADTGADADPDTDLADGGDDADVSEGPDFSLLGWAATGAGTTGGAGGDAVTVSTTEDFLDAIDRDDAVVVRVAGSLDFANADSSHSALSSSKSARVKSDKSILGVGSDAELLNVDLSLDGVSNVIIRNLRLAGAPEDAIGLRNGATHVWIDHNDLSDANDGLIDITKESDFVTVSWNRFSNHDKTSLVGASDGQTADRGRLHVTYHHNWFEGTNQRHPRVRYGQVHVFNNFHDQTNAGIGIGVEAQIYMEHEYFDRATTPWHYQDSNDQPGYIKDNGSVVVDPGNPRSLSEDGVQWSPDDHYTYALDPAEDVPAIVSAHAGVGVIDP